ncbi:DMT family transporter [Pseudomonas sp. UV AK001]|uniref:DMT family transporter n=1 Tax=Pseudomonas sp. UV AK001 TaxID=3384791 RepID=UPI0038D44E4C
MKSFTSPIGIAAALFAAFTWSLNFLAPMVVGSYSIYDLAACRFLISSLLGFGIILINYSACKGLTLNDWLTTCWLGFIGYVGYFLAIVVAAKYAGPVIAPAFLGLVPVVLAIAGNFRGGVPWRHLRAPLTMALIGLILVNFQELLNAHKSFSLSLTVGIIAAIAAVALWTWFGLANQKALAQRPSINSWVWTGMMMIGGGIQTVIVLPVPVNSGLFKADAVGLALNTYSVHHLYLPALLLAIVASMGGAWAWTIASKRLPISLASQLLSMEMVFATGLGLLVSARWPTAYEAFGIILIVLGVVKVISVFNQASAIETEPRMLNVRGIPPERSSL